MGLALLVGKTRGVDAGLSVLDDVLAHPVSTSTMSSKHVPTHAARRGVTDARPYIFTVFMRVCRDCFNIFLLSFHVHTSKEQILFNYSFPMPSSPHSPPK